MVFAETGNKKVAVKYVLLSNAITKRDNDHNYEI